MSWSMSTTLKREGNTADLANEVNKLRALDRSMIGNSNCVKERDEQIEAAITSAFQLFACPIFDNAAEITVSLSGHANPDHQKASGWADETINVQVWVSKYRD